MVQKKGKSRAESFDFTEYFDCEKLHALTLYMEKKGLSLSEALAQHLKTLYNKNVPREVRFFLDSDMESIVQPAENGNKKEREEAPETSENEV